MTSIAAIAAAWFTPTSLFVFLNLVIGTILLSTRFHSHKKHPHLAGHPPSLLERVKSIDFPFFKTDYDHRFDPPQLARAPSLLERVKSIDFSLYKFNQPTESDYRVDSPELVRSPSLLDRMKSIKSYLHKSDQPEQPDPIYHDHEQDHIKRNNSDVKPASGETPARLPKKMRKSASEKSPFRHFEEEEVEIIETHRPATARGERTAPYGGDDAVDEKADDFINRFKQQLKLQRLDSILRYKEMIGRGS